MDMEDLDEIYADVKKVHDRQYICPICKKDYGDIFGLWFSSICKSNYRTEHTCKMCGHKWFTS